MTHAAYDKKSTSRRVWITWGVLTLAIVAWWYIWPKEGAFDCGLAADVVAHVQGGEVTRVTLAGREVEFNQGSRPNVNNVLVQVPEFSESYFQCHWGNVSWIAGTFFAGLFIWPAIGAIAAAIVWRLHPSYDTWKAEQVRPRADRASDSLCSTRDGTGPIPYDRDLSVDTRPTDSCDSTQPL